MKQCFRVFLKTKNKFKYFSKKVLTLYWGIDIIYKSPRQAATNKHDGNGATAVSADSSLKIK